jgi:DNA-binding response OmpR family regulator
MSATEKIRVILVEDDQDLRETIQEYMSHVGFSVKAVACGMDYYQAIALESYNVAVIDVMLPDQSGLVLAEYTRKNTNCAIIVLTAINTLEIRVSSYGQGADLFLAKPVDCQELVAAITSLSKRHEITPPVAPAQEVATYVLDRDSRSIIIPAGTQIALTHKEFQLLSVLALTPCELVPREELLDQIYLHHDESTSRALDTLVRRVRGKIGRNAEKPSPLLSSYGCGYSFSAPIKIK